MRLFLFLCCYFLLAGFIFGYCWYGCANANVAPAIILAPGSDPVPLELQYHIVAQTNRFCQEEGSPGVARLTIMHRAKEQVTAVSYLCIENPK